MAKKKLPVVNVAITCKKGKCKIHPSVIIVRPGQTIEFDKSAVGKVYVQVSGIGGLFDFKAKKYSLTIPKKTRMGLYPYAVFCYKSKTFCTGSSMPIIIVPR